MENLIYWLVTSVLLFGFITGLILDYLNSKSWKNELPEDLKDFYTDEQYTKARNYYFDKEKLGLISGILFFVITFVLFVSGGYGMISDYFYQKNSNPILHALIFFGILHFASDFLHIPFSLFSIFKIEEKYGFNKTTPKTYILDKLKGYALTILLGGGILSLLIFLIDTLGENFWLVAYFAMLTISLFMNVFYTTLFVPIFNKLSPLEEGELKSEIENYARKVNFPLTNIMVIDGSKRSTKANAYFSGLFKKKKIILFDTLIQKHSIPELIAVLAHEVGHYKKKHIVKGMVVSAIQSLVMFYILSLLIFNKNFSLAFGSQIGNAVLPLNLMAISILFQPASMISGLFGNYFSRRNEFQADTFAVESTGSPALADALKRLSVDHLSNLKPHPLYVFFHYSHPPLLKRMEGIMNVFEKNKSDHNK